MRTTRHDSGAHSRRPVPGTGRGPGSEAARRGWGAPAWKHKRGSPPGTAADPWWPRQFCGTGRGSWAQARAAPAPGMPILRSGCVGPVCPGLLTWQKGRPDRLPLADEPPVILPLPVVSSFLTFCREEIHPPGSLTGKEAGRTQPGPGLSWGADPATSPGPSLGQWQKGEKQIDFSGPSAPPLPAQEQFALIGKATQILQRAGLPAAHTAGKFFLNYFFIA